MPDPSAPGRRVRAHVTISGRVQGVFYRSSACDMARALGLSGFVQNLDDGRVEAVFEGVEAEVQRAVAWCRRGPALARVDAVEVEWEAPTGESSRFSVSHG